MALYTLSLDTASLHVSKGNSKIGDGIWSFSTLPGDSEHLLYVNRNGTKMLLTDVPGTCSGACDACFGSCYAKFSALRHHNVNIKAWGENTLLLRSGRLFRLLDEFLTRKNAKRQTVKVFRQNVSGEIESADELRQWVALAKKHPTVRFYTYTKNFDALAAYLDGGEDFPENYVVNISQWHGVADAFLAKYSWAKLNVFSFDDSLLKGCDLPQEEKDRLAKLPHCAAVTPQGHHAKLSNGEDVTCTICGRCTRKTGLETAVYAH